MPILETRYGKIDPKNYWFGCVNPHVVAAGWCGGIGRGLVEGPFEMVKVRRQVVSGWQYNQLLNGFGATMFRNAFLFSSFVIYMDIFKQNIEQKYDMTVTPFIKAGTCATLAWLTIWPLDVSMVIARDCDCTSTPLINLMCIIDICIGDKDKATIWKI